MRDFITSKKDSLKFVANFHCYGPAILIPDNAKFPN